MTAQWVRTRDPADTLQTAVRLGAGWSTSAIVFQTAISTPASGIYDIFVDTLSAGIQVTPGSLFVIEMHGQNTGT